MIISQPHFFHLNVNNFIQCENIKHSLVKYEN